MLEIFSVETFPVDDEEATELEMKDIQTILLSINLNSHLQIRNCSDNWFSS